MNVDDLARSAAQDVRARTATTFDIDDGFARIPASSRRRTIAQHSSALAVVIVVLILGVLAVRPHVGTVPEPVTTPTPAPTAPSSERPLGIENAVVRPDPAEHRSYVILTVRNTLPRSLTSLGAHYDGFDGPAGSARRAVDYELFTTAAAGKAMLAAPGAIEDIIQSSDDRPSGHIGPGESLTGIVRVLPDCTAATPLPAGDADVVVTDPSSTSMIYEPLIKVPGDTPTWLSAAVTAACSAPPPGSDVVDTLAPAVVVDGTGAQTVELGIRPPEATRVEIRLACLSTGVFHYADHTGLDCTEWMQGAHPLPLEPSTVITLAPGQHTTRITATTGAKWKLSTTYDRVRRVPWGINPRGQTFGVANSDGTPDLVLVVADNGQIGYAEAARMVRSDIPPSAPDPGRLTVTVYASDGQTVLGHFLNY